jgi:hypothetical protein
MPFTHPDWLAEDILESVEFRSVLGGAFERAQGDSVAGTAGPPRILYGGEGIPVEAVRTSDRLVEDDPPRPVAHLGGKTVGPGDLFR